MIGLQKAYIEGTVYKLPEIKRQTECTLHSQEPDDMVDDKLNISGDDIDE